MGSQDVFSWGVWVSLSRDNFARALEVWNTEDREAERPRTCVIPLRCSTASGDPRAAPTTSCPGSRDEDDGCLLGRHGDQRSDPRTRAEAPPQTGPRPSRPMVRPVTGLGAPSSPASSGTAGPRACD
ncbi:DUF2199 domain-containing protein [Streptomyces avermitilis]